MQKKVTEISVERNSVFRAIKENAHTVITLLFSIISFVFVVVVTWCIFLINAQNHKQIQLERKLETQTVYMSVLSNDYKNMKTEYKKLKE